MKKLILMASAAAMAVAMPALAQGNGKGNGGGKPEAGQSENRGNGNGKGAKSNRGDEREARSAGRSDRREFRAERDDDDDDRREVRRVARTRDNDDDRWDRDDDDDNNDRWDRGDRRMVGNGQFCPPGLAKKGNGCLPPGQAKKIFARGERLNSEWYDRYNVPASHRDMYSDNSDSYYRYDDGGYIYRVNRQSNLVSGLIPLLGGGFSVGQLMPLGFGAYNVPMQYRDTYYDSDESYYRYGDNAIYQVDPKTQMIQSVVALLTGDTLGIGQTLPGNYDAYNLPVDYRDQYYDNNQSIYRYADGNIYQADAKTQIIQAVISALI